MITHAERVRATLAGEACDRPPIALWRHFPVADQAPERLAAATLAFQAAYDWDIVKVTPSSSFCLRDWGAADAWTGKADGTRPYTHHVIGAPRDWQRLPELAPDAPHLAAQRACLALIRASLAPDVPLVQTVFSPLAQAKNLAGADTLMEHLRTHPDAVMAGLETIARSTRRFVEALLETGIDGVFYAVQHAQPSRLSEADYRLWGLPHDRMVMAPAAGLWCNMLHLHGDDVQLALARACDFPIVNWHDRDGGPTLTAARGAFAGVLCGGLRPASFAPGADAALIDAEARDALAQTGARGHILGAGCVLPYAAPHRHLLAARASVMRR